MEILVKSKFLLLKISIWNSNIKTQNFFTWFNISSFNQRTCNPTLTNCIRRSYNEFVNYFSKLWIISRFFKKIIWFWNWILSQLSWVLQSGKRIKELMGHHTVFHRLLMGVSSNNLIALISLSPNHLIFILVLNWSCHWHHMCQPTRNNVSIICCKMILTPGGFRARWTKANERVIYFLKTRMPIY